MKLEELEHRANPVLDAEVCDMGSDDEFEDDAAEDLGVALDYLEQCLLMLENIHIKKGKIVKIPDGMLDLMEEVFQFLDQFEGMGTAELREKRLKESQPVGWKPCVG